MHVTAAEMMERIRQVVEENGSQKEAAIFFNITPQYLSDILKNRRAISPVVAKALGYEPVIVYVEIAL